MSMNFDGQYVSFCLSIQLVSSTTVYLGTESNAIHRECLKHVFIARMLMKMSDPYFCFLNHY